MQVEKVQAYEQLLLRSRAVESRRRRLVRLLRAMRNRALLRQALQTVGVAA